MRKLPKSDLPPEILAALQGYQEELARLPYHDQVQQVSDFWAAKRKLKPFDTVKVMLRELCSGENRCCYCEDSAGDEIEHVFPKSVFPSLTFSWENYLYACGPCNGPKNNQFPLKLRASGETEYFTHPKVGVKVPPPPGDPLLINPRQDDPFAELALLLDADARGLDFAPISPNLHSLSFCRAVETIKVLRLNDRRDLAVRRKKAFQRYKAALENYAAKKQSGATPDALAKIKAALLDEDHPTVWREIQRYKREGKLKNVDEQLDAYFAAAPEALAW